MLSEESVVNGVSKCELIELFIFRFFMLVVLTPLGYVNYTAFGVLGKTTVLLVTVVNSQFISQHVFWQNRSAIKISSCETIIRQNLFLYNKFRILPHFEHVCIS